MARPKRVESPMPVPVDPVGPPPAPPSGGAGGQVARPMPQPDRTGPLPGNARIDGSKVVVPPPLPSANLRRFESDEIRQKREAYEASLQAEAKAKADAAKAKQEEQDRLAVAEARKTLVSASRENPIELRRVIFSTPVTFEESESRRTEMIDKANQGFVDTVVLFDGAFVHVVRVREPHKSFVVPVTAVAALYPRVVKSAI